MTTAVASVTVICPGCGASQEPVWDLLGDEPLVASCRECQANLVFVNPEHQRPRQKPSQPVPSPNPSRSVPTSSRLAVGLICLLAYALLGLGLYGASYGVKQLPPYKAAELFVAQHPHLTEVLGEPMTFGWFPSVQFDRQGKRPHAYIELAATGPRTTGTISLFLDAQEGNWTVREAEYQVAQAEVARLWVRFPGDYELIDRLEAATIELDDAINDRDIDGMMRHLAPHARIRTIAELPSGRTVRTYRTREEYRREILAEILLRQDLTWDRLSTDFQLGEDGRSATGTIEGTQQVVGDEGTQTFAVHQRITYTFDGTKPVITSMERIEHLVGSAS